MEYVSIASGSSGNCHMIADKNTKILVDAGLSGKKIEENLKKINLNLEKTKAILITHEHIDHIKGAGILSRRYNIPIYANENTWEFMKDKLGKINDENIKIIKNECAFCIDDVQIMPFSINHDATDPIAYSFENKGKKLSIVTDTGYIDENIKKHISGSNLVVLESNHDEEMLKMGSYPYYLKRRVLSDKGHLSNEDAGNACIDLVCSGTSNILLAHLSRENNFPQLAFETVNSN